MTEMESIVKSILHFHICQEALPQMALPILVTCYTVYYEQHMNVLMSARKLFKLRISGIF
jgi:hypothetical protein